MTVSFVVGTNDRLWVRGGRLGADEFRHSIAFPMSDAPAAADHLPRTLAAIERGMRQGLHIGAQLYVSLRGEVIADVAIGEAKRGVAMRPDTLMLWLSAGKPITAVAIGQLRERGLLDWDDRVA